MADHKETDATIPGLTGERVKSVVAVLVPLYATVNALLAAGGRNPLPFTSDDVSTAVFTLVSLASTVYAWWRSNAVTQAAAVGKQVTKAIKANQTEIDTSADLIAVPELDADTADDAGKADEDGTDEDTVPEATDEELSTIADDVFGETETTAGGADA